MPDALAVNRFLTQRGGRWLIAGILVALVLLGAFLFRGPILAFAVAQGAAAAGYEIGYGAISSSGGRLVIERPDVRSKHGEPVFTAERIAIVYDVRRIFGSANPFGISSVDVDRPKLTYIKHRDGSSNITLPASGSSQNAKPFVLPQVRVALHDGSIGILDDTRIFAHSRRIAVENLQVDANLAPSEISHVAFGLTLLDADGKFPIAGRGTLDPARGIELTRIDAKTIGLSALVDYALNSTALHVAGGVLNAIDARIYGLRAHDGSMARHLSVTANLDHFQPYLGGIAKPLRDGRGALRVYDDGLAIPKVDGSIAAIPVRIAGGIYDLSHPTLRLGIAGRGDLGKLVTLADAAKKLPLAGPLAFKLFVEGDATQPLTLATFDSPRLTYGRIPLDRPSGAVALHGKETAILRSAVGYAGASAGVRGMLVLDKHTDVDLVAGVSAPANRFPVARDVLGAMRIDGTVAVTGTDARLQTAGVLAGATSSTRLAGTFSVDGTGVGDVGPITIDGPGDRALYARVALDRPHGGGGAAFVSLRDFHVATGGREPALPGLSTAALPHVSGTLDGDLAAALADRNVLAGGTLHAAGVRALGYPVDDLASRFAVAARTDRPRDARVAADLRYRGALAPLARAAGGTFSATGRVDIPVRIETRGTTQALAQIRGARFTDASIAGIALRSLEGTVGVRGRAIDVYGVRAGIANGNVVARGSFGNGGTLEVSSSGIDLGTLRAAGLPVRAGTVSAVATIDGTAAAPHVRGGVAASGVRSADPALAGLSVDANTGLSYDGSTLGVSNAIVAAGPAVADLDGTVSGLRGSPANARYAFSTHLRQADIATLAKLAHANRLYPEGTLDADVRVAGSGSAPSIAGDVAIPEGSLNGLRFRDGHVALAGSAADVQARAGRVTVGESTLGFSADVTHASQSAALHAPHVDLADFNDFFDTGDLLGGRGSLDLAADNEPNAVRTSGRVRLTDTRVKRFEIGDTAADWSTTGRTVHTSADVGSGTGRITERGDVTLAASAPLRDALHRTHLALETRAEAVDLGVWLPAAGIQAPVLGLIDANASVRGTYPDLAVGAHAALRSGLVQRIPIRTATIDATASRGRAVISNAVLAIDDLSASASGNVGLSQNPALDLHLSATTPDVAALAKTLTGKTLDAAGRITTTARVGGTARRPNVSDIVDADGVRYAKYTVPHAHAELSIDPARVSVSRTEVDLQRGKILVDGFAPLRPNFAGVAGGAPLQLDLTAQAIDLAQFEPLAPKGTTIAGTLDGRVGLVGDLDDPGLSGALDVRDGSFVGPQERSKISALNSELAFAGRTMTLRNTSAKVGGGTLSAAGTLAVPDLRDPATSAAVALSANADNALFDLPNLFRGRINGSIALARPSGAADAQVSGNVAVTSARISTAALLPKTPTATSNATPLPVTLALGVNVGNDVRVQGGPVDIGAKGDVQVGGTVGSPTVNGELVSTGGTLSFYRTFRIQYPTTVSFHPSNGVIPDVDALATTTVDNPQTDVNLHVTGLATALNVDLSSDPSYTREQILGLLVGAQALGAVSGVASSTQTGAQANPYAALAEGQLGNLLTQNILEPFSSQLGSAVGLNNLEVNYQPGGSLGLGAQKQIFKNVNAVFAQSFNYPQRQTIGIIATPKKSTAYQFTLFSSPSSNRYQTLEANDLLSTNQSVTSSQPARGTNGYSISIQRKFH